jgi:hypothetical protein
MYFQIGEFRWFIWKHGSATKPNVIKCRSAKHLGKHQEILTKVRSPHRLSMWHNEGCGERCQPSGGPGKMSANYLRGGLDEEFQWNYYSSYLTFKDHSVSWMLVGSWCVILVVGNTRAELLNLGLGSWWSGMIFGYGCKMEPQNGYFE